MVNALKNHNLEGVYFLICSQLFLASMDAMGKSLSATFSPLVLVWARYSVLFLIILAFKGRAVLQLAISSCYTKTHILRATLLLVTSLLGLYALQLLPLAETAGLAFTSPLFAILLARFLLGEHVGLLRWLCMLGVILGAFLVIRPGSKLSMEGVFLVISASISFAFYQVLTRKLALKEGGLILLAYPAALGTFLPAILVPFVEGGNSAYDLMNLPLIPLLGLLSGIGHYFSNRAFALTSVSRLAPFMYLQLLWAVLLGWLFFGQLPDVLSYCGFVLIIAFGLISTLKNSLLR